MSKYILDASTNNPPAGYWELVTSFAKGVLVSTRYALSKDEPKRRIFRLLDSKNQPEDMLAKHEKRTNELAVKLGEIQKVKADLKGLAEEVEQSIRRLIG